MWQDENEFIVRCSCHDPRCLTHLSFWEDDLMLIIGAAIDVAPFWRKIKNAFLYLFRGRKLWNHGEIILLLEKPEQLKELKDLRAFLGKVIEQVEKKP